jgi:hypothetical protein
VGRTPWKAADITAFGYMLELSHSGMSTLSWAISSPTIFDLSPEIDGPLAYALGAWSIKVFSHDWHWLSPHEASRIPFILMCALSVVCTWYSVFYLALSPKAKPLQFAFGGQANPKDYALALADSSALSLIATLGLAQLGHESTPTLGQMFTTSLIMLGFSLMAFKPYKALLSLCAGLFGLTLMGAPSLSPLLGLTGALICVLDKDSSTSKQHGFFIVLFCLGTCILAHLLELWHWRVLPSSLLASEMPSLGKLWIWFFWPLWPLVLWTLWHWRNQWFSTQWSRHLIAPLAQTVLITAAAFITYSQERTLLLALPSMAVLATFSLPTIKRGVKALIDWFTLLLFSGCAFVIWVIWIAYQTGWPAQPARNVARLVPGFIPNFSGMGLLIALVATGAWIFLVHWRVGRNPSALWKTLILPAGGASLCWLLLMSLWLSPLDYGRGYVAFAHNVHQTLGESTCAYAWKLNKAEIIALQYHEGIELIDFQKSDQILDSLLDQVKDRSPNTAPQCSWILVNGEHKQEFQSLLKRQQLVHWSLRTSLRKPSDPDEDIVVFGHNP